MHTLCHGMIEISVVVYDTQQRRFRSKDDFRWTKVSKFIHTVPSSFSKIDYRLMFELKVDWTTNLKGRPQCIVITKIIQIKTSVIVSVVKGHSIDRWIVFQLQYKNYTFKPENYPTINTFYCVRVAAYYPLHSTSSVLNGNAQQTLKNEKKTRTGFTKSSTTHFYPTTRASWCTKVHHRQWLFVWIVQNKRPWRVPDRGRPLFDSKNLKVTV